MEPQQRRELDELMEGSATPIAPPDELKLSIMSAIATTPQVSSLAAHRRANRSTRFFAAAAASFVLLTGIGSVAFFSSRAPEPDSVTAAGIDEMHAIMDASDLRQGTADAMGASLDIVVSSGMGKGGAMVDGQPALGNGMGAQVWAVMSDGAMMSAGVIGQEPHDSVWMPLPGDTVSVMVTEEPANGMPQPTGPVLAVVDFQ
ncbi:anti-sigma factor [Corynebacterium mayonis]|uniref:anti-sigma factor n=1 Tax=Corynebacterium mayonis TaxID=3062461 RepID=UPI00313FF0B9